MSSESSPPGLYRQLKFNLSPLELHHFSSQLPSSVQDAREAWGSVRQRARLARLPVVHEPEPEATVAGSEIA